MPNVNILFANPSGNPTIFVLDFFEEEDYARVAAKLFSLEKFKAEKIAFAAKSPPAGCDGAIKLAGHEFSGNATRAFGLYIAKQMGISGEGVVNISVSGCESPVPVKVNTKTGQARAIMPLPISVEKIDCPIFSLLHDKNIFNFDGIMHIVLKDISADERTFDRIKDFIIDNYNPLALGVMFYDTKFKSFVPAVFVREVDTVIFEGSCASGAVAVSHTLCQNKADGTYHFHLLQPADALDVTVEKEDGVIRTISVEGNVRLFDPVTVAID